MIKIAKIKVNINIDADVSIKSDKYLDINKSNLGFDIQWKKSNKQIKKTMKHISLSSDIDNAIAYGAYDDDKLIGFIEAYYEEWNNRFRISNLFIFEEAYQNKGIGTRLIKRIEKDATKTKARMLVLETQSYNSKAILFYETNGFEIIGFDRYAYTNSDPRRHEMRIEMGKKLK